MQDRLPELVVASGALPALVVIVSAVFSAGLVVALLPWLQRVAADIPSHRSSHVTPVPRGAGLAVMGGVLAGAGLAALAGAAIHPALLFACVSLAGLGFMDDLRSLGVRLRLGATGVVCVVVTLLVVRPDDGVDALVVLVATVGIVGFVNAFNFMDGINGISGTTVLVGAAWLGWVASDLGLDGGVALAAALAGGALGFLPFNVPRPVAFLGDAGSYSLGVGLAALSLWLWVEGASIVAVAAPLFLYFLDTGVTLMDRIRRGEDATRPHRDHVYQRLVDRGLGHPTVSAVVGAFSALVCVLAATLSAPYWLAAAGAAGLGYLALPRVATQREALGA